MVNSAGTWTGHGPDAFKESMMFDSNPKTSWHSNGANQNNLKIIGIQFEVKIPVSSFMVKGAVTLSKSSIEPVF